MARKRKISAEKGGGGYEQLRQQRIKENKERLEKLGIFDLKLKLKPKRHPHPQNIPENSSRHKTLNPVPISQQPPRRSSRLILRSNLSANKKPTEKSGKKSVKAAKDPNKPKRPASAFFVFMEEFREQYKRDHPENKSVAAVGKAGGDKWKSLSEAEKKTYVDKAEKRKVEYEKNMKAYNKRQAEGPKDEDVESEKSASEVNDEDDDDE
ncbi:hypothetical protein REPUB_Repub04eG0066500 [Reevesia pubescens]